MKRPNLQGNSNPAMSFKAKYFLMSMSHACFLLLLLFLQDPNQRMTAAFETVDAASEAKYGNGILPTTGSWQNCTNDNTFTIYHHNHHPDSAYTFVSCQTIHYRIPSKSLSRIQQNEIPLIVGILSGAQIQDRRTSIRSTWGYKKHNIFFIVGGPWENVQKEYDLYQDLLWIDKEEIYVTETSVLTFKTESFLSIMYDRMMKKVKGGESTSKNDKDNDTMVKYLFKTDDDSYVDLHKLYQTLPLNDNDNDDNTIHYWGKCNKGGWKPHRNQEIEWQKKWYISYETYPEPEYPPYCQGAGFALSKSFLDCAIGDGHVAKVRYMPNEDVAVGMLAERCSIVPTNDDRVAIRWDEEEEEGATMDDKVVQHYVKNEKNMRLHHKSATGVMGPILVL